MCGIAGFALTKQGRKQFPVDAFAKHLLLGIESRGEHATGYMTAVPNQKPKVDYAKEAVKASEFIKNVHFDRRAKLALLHTRAWTKGDPKDNENNHPVLWNTCYAIHNGSIRNDDDVLVEAGVDKEHRVGEVDSFAVPVALEYHGWGDPEDIKTSLHMLKGSFAIAAADPYNKPNTVLLAKGADSPLEILLHQSGIFWASTRKAIQDAWGATLGTPPVGTTMNPNHFGWFSMMEGDWWKIDTSTDSLVIKSGRFEVNRGWTYNGANQGTSGYSYRPYTVEEHDFTCWPNEKNCVFQQDCGNCHSGDCECWEGNPNHPYLNEGLDWGKLSVKYSNFESAMKRHNITRDMVERPGETSGVRVVSNGLRVIKPNPSASPSHKELTSGSTESPTESKNTSHLSIVGQTGRSSPVSADCFFCEQSFPTKEMDKLNTVIEGIPYLYACKPCNTATRSLSKPIGHNEKFRPKIKALFDEAKQAEEIVTAALQETAWEFKMPPALIRHVCTINPNNYVGSTDPDFAKLILEVRQAFRANAKIVSELRELDRTHD